ncbi:MAG TPA: NAD(P)H-dependent oxidoreductase [Bryobacteraceae bacterium]|nr:NAD(P)H-dependent oxidoreductase [Bryobacteraceae bacterium]HOL71758.1 NAD(P)H-dependent oxidoreductase [Bryobacteraceae bacterium]HOQ46523.1 NAD(P)H-dependent oxidoreductase [Bryobacteraceae bacterium]HPQ14785.1 NAD(P)H-dependent oxidoreductase [Bryobacteraceae bacterium]HPU73314.1 NAD(P)H-dependent oxidoreductase [Bryobacteraceae bacterium]
MPTLLHIDSSPLPGSVSRELTAEFARTWKAAHPDGEVIYRDLAAHPPTPIDEKWIGAAHTAPGELSAEQRAALALSDELIGELERADEYVIGVAMHNFSIPAVLKLWIDQIVRRGRTFAYSAKGPRGFLQDKKATIVVASGGVYAPGTPAAAMNFIDPYLKTIFEFLGVTDVKFIAAEGTARMMSGAIDRCTFLKPVVEQVRAAAA